MGILEKHNMFGFVSLGGGLKFKAFLWEAERPEWFEAVVLCSPLALEHELVSLHFQIPAERVFLNEEIESGLTAENAAMVEKCRLKVANQEPIGHKLSFMRPEDFQEAQMEAELEAMLQEMDGESSRPLSPSPEGGFFSPTGSAASDFEGGLFYTAETFGGAFVDEQKDSEPPFFKTDSIKLGVLEQILDATPKPVLTPRFSFTSLPSTNKGNLGQLLSTPVDPELGFCFMDLDELNADEDDETQEIVDDYRACHADRAKQLKRFATTVPHLKVSFELPEEDDFEREPALLERQPAFVSTRGKEREIWQTYRAEITATWKAELEEIRRELLNEVGNHVPKET